MITAHSEIKEEIKLCSYFWLMSLHDHAVWEYWYESRCAKLSLRNKAHETQLFMLLRRPYYFSIDLVSVYFFGKCSSLKVPGLKWHHSARGSAFRALSRPLIPNVENWFSVQSITGATDTVHPLTLSLFGLNRAASPRGIINQPKARRLD